jgi:membrane protein DedA with SNARE-associated domain
MNSGWAGLPGFLLTLPLSTIVITVFLFPAIAARFGYEIQMNMTEYQAEFGFMLCAFLNAIVLYPFYVWWKNRKRRSFEAPPPPSLELRNIPDGKHG